MYLKYMKIINIIKITKHYKITNFCDFVIFHKMHILILVFYNLSGQLEPSSKRILIDSELKFTNLLINVHYYS